MNALVGLPDFGTAIAGGSAVVFAAFGGGAYMVMPQAGALTAFLLTMTHAAGDTSVAGSYAMLDLEVGCHYPLDEALALARNRTSGATVTALPIDLGYARLVSAGSVIALPDAVTRPIMLGWSKNDGARWSQRLDVDIAEVIKGAVQKASLLFGVRIEFVVRGAAARAAATVSFVPAALMPQLLSPGQTSFTREDLITRLSDASRSAALQTAATRIDIAEAVADRLLATLGQFTPATGPLDFPCFTIAAPLPTERLDWDLSRPAAGARGYALRLDTVCGLSSLDPKSLVQEITIPPLDLGFREVALAANLPARRIGAPAIGVRLSAPPAPPNRPNGINQTVTFNPPDDAARVSLRFDPEETFAFDLTPFTVVAAGGLAHEFDAPSTHSSASFVQLQAGDFQLAFTHVTASDRLAAAAVIDGALTYAYGSKTAAMPFKLVAGAGDIAVAMPIGATDASLSLTATSPDGTVLKLPLMAPGRIALDFPSFAEYGPQKIAIHCEFQRDEPPLTLELEPEDGVGAASVSLAPSAPDNSWTYFATTPFRARYRFRPQRGDWSPMRAPGAPLRVSAQGELENPLDPGPPAPPQPFELDGVKIATDPSRSGVLRYLPASPTPELDKSGKPTLTILKTSQTASLQFGVHFDLPAGGEAALAKAIAQARPTLAGATLQPALVQVQHIAVKLDDGTGKSPEIASAVGSAFPPYAAVFAIPLDAAQASQAISAVGGRSGVLSVEYTISAPGEDAPLIKSADIANWFAGASGLNHVRVFAES